MVKLDTTYNEFLREKNDFITKTLVLGNECANKKTVSHKFLYGSTLFDAKKRGIFGPNSAVSFAKILDGASNTILVGEMQRLWPNPTLTDVAKTSTTSNDGWAVAGVANLFTTAVADEDGDEGQTGGMNNKMFMPIRRS